MIYHETPVFEIRDPTIKDAGVRLLVKREDLNHPYISGNKWWKLKYNFEAALSQNCQCVLTFGGAYSNHIYAVAAAAAESGVRSVGVIRGEKISPLNQTLQFAADRGMELQFISRGRYREKDAPSFIEELKKAYGEFYLIPEGGTNSEAVRGCKEFFNTQLSQLPFDHLFLPVGTGGTIAGLISGSKGFKNITGVSVLKNGDFLIKEVQTLVKSFSNDEYGNWQLLTSYDQGGYAKVPDQLKRFIVMMNERHNLPLDPVYTGKMMWAIYAEIARGSFSRGTTILALHTGGLQGASSLL